MLKLSQEELAYIAGIIDGEGCISLHKQKTKLGRPYYFVVVVVGNTSYDLIRWLYEKVPGCICKVKRTGNRQDMWQWLCSNKIVAEFLGLILPYMIIKNKQAELAIQHQSLIRHGMHRLSTNELQQREAMYVQFRFLNRRGKEARKDFHIPIVESPQFSMELYQ